MDAAHEVVIEGVAGFSSGQGGEGRCETAAASWSHRTTRAPERIVGFGRADIMLAGAAGCFAAGGVLARRTTGVFQREEGEIKEERVQLEALKKGSSVGHGSGTIQQGARGDSHLDVHAGPEGILDVSRAAAILHQQVSMVAGLLLIGLEGAAHGFCRRDLCDDSIRVVFPLATGLAIDTLDAIPGTAGAFGTQLCTA